MPKYALFRDLPPTLTRTDLDGMVLATRAALDSFMYRGEANPSTGPHGIAWLRSYWQRGGTWGMCVFEAPNLSVLAAFQEMCASPFIDAMEVREAAANAETLTPVAVTFELEAEAADPIAVTQHTLGARRTDIGRVYWNAERRMAVSMLAAEPSVGREGLKVESGLVELAAAEYA